MQTILYCVYISNKCYSTAWAAPSARISEYSYVGLGSYLKVLLYNKLLSETYLISLTFFFNIFRINCLDFFSSMLIPPLPLTQWSIDLFCKNLLLIIFFFNPTILIFPKETHTCSDSIQRQPHSSQFKQANNLHGNGEESPTFLFKITSCIKNNPEKMLKKGFKKKKYLIKVFCLSHSV